MGWFALLNVVIILKKNLLFIKFRDSNLPFVCLEFYELWDVQKENVAELDENISVLEDRRNPLFYQKPISSRQLSLSKVFEPLEEQDYQETSGISSQLAESSQIPFVDAEDLSKNNDLEKSLIKILSSVKETRNYHRPATSIAQFSNQENDLNLALPSNFYTSPKFERQERLDVKKPGPWFTVNNFAFESEEDDDPTADDMQLKDTLLENDYLFDSLETNAPSNNDDISYEENRTSSTESKKETKFTTAQHLTENIKAGDPNPATSNTDSKVY